MQCRCCRSIWRWMTYIYNRYFANQPIFLWSNARSLRCVLFFDLFVYLTIAKNVNKPSSTKYLIKSTSTTYQTPYRDNQHHYSQPIPTTTTKDWQFPVISKINTKMQSKDQQFPVILKINMKQGLALKPVIQLKTRTPQMSKR